jgi:hypothetical protein
MNERIIELAEQAGFENGHQDRYGNSLSQELEQFAELIVAEGSEEDSYSNKFVQSQIDYYKKHLLSGNTSDQHRIRGSLMNYERIKNQRIKNNTWQEQGVAEGARVAFATAIGDGTPDEIYDAIKETFRS